MPIRLACCALALLIACMLPHTAAAQDVVATDYSPLVPSLLPSVVNILKVRFVPVLDANGKPSADGAIQRVEAQGTGFIIDRTGIIVTNRHVTDGAARLFVTLYDGSRVQAALMYRSPDLDMAMLRIRSTIELQPITWGDSDAMLAGMPVLAIGNPLGFGFTVTHGIVSALDRDIKETAVDSFIQVDAPINPGNSGGPLFNIHGEVIGMNTAFEAVDNTGGSVGLNFAIPGNDLQFVVNQLKEFGQVRIGTTGVVAQGLTQDMADAVGLPYPEGVVIAFIPKDSPAAASQLRVGDIILQVDGQEIPNVRRLTRVTGALGVGQIVPFLVLRAGAQVAVPVKIGEAAASLDPRNRLMLDPTPAPRIERPDLGLTIAAVSETNRKQFGIPAGVDGAVVTGAMANTMSEDVGIAVGDVVLRINDVDINSMTTLRDAIASARATGRPSMMVLVLDHQGTHWIAVPVPPAG